jgi:quinol-cytochrome oxidoreductase complex cytochrome b subunit
MSKKDSCRIHAFLLGNVALSLLVFAAVLYFILTGEYVNLHDRSATEAVLNSISIGSLLYAGVFLIIALMTKPFLCSVKQE